ncbi:MAG: TIM44-like domain-containing protein [Pseudobdellovibrionaceae bacterium]
MRRLPLLRTLAQVLPIIFFATDAFARAGGGHGGGGGWLGIVLAPFFIAYSIWVNWKINRRLNQTSMKLEEMAKREPQWSKENLMKISQTLFVETQTAWGAQDLSALKSILHPMLYPSWEQQIQFQKFKNERNVLVGLSINNIRIVGVQNYADDNKDNFTVCIDAKADDQTIREGKVVESDKSSFREFWTFEWHEGQWKLFEVTQASGWKRFLSAEIIDESSIFKGKAG